MDLSDFELTIDDYKKIIKYYGIQLPKNASKRRIRNAAEGVMGTKLCKCIRALSPSQQPSSPSLQRSDSENSDSSLSPSGRSSPTGHSPPSNHSSPPKQMSLSQKTAICTRSLFTNRSLKHYRFTCKRGKHQLLPKKGTRNRRLTKTIHDPIHLSST
jgi:hypothetical protein